MMKMKDINLTKYWPLLVAILLLGCRTKKEKKLSTPTSGEISIVADESLKPIVDAEIEAFEALYQRAEIKVDYLPEAEAVHRFMEDSAVLAVLTRSLTDREVSAVKAERIIPSKVKIGTGAVALIVHNQNPDSVITMEQIRGIFSGKITKWMQIGGASSPKEPIQIVFANKNASTTRFIKDSLFLDKLPENTYAVESYKKVIEYVSRNKNALGVIGVNWISDNDNSRVLGFLDQIQVMAVSNESADEYYKPYQAYIANGDYPLTRDIYIVSREARSGLGSGFMSFAAGAKGQRILLKSGLVPATMPVRILQFSE